MDLNGIYATQYYVVDTKQRLETPPSSSSSGTMKKLSRRSAHYVYNHKQERCVTILCWCKHIHHSLSLAPSLLSHVWPPSMYMYVWIKPHLLPDTPQRNGGGWSYEKQDHMWYWRMSHVIKISSYLYTVYLIGGLLSKKWYRFQNQCSISHNFVISDTDFYYFLLIVSVLSVTRNVIIGTCDILWVFCHIYT